jgi:hypothetical protein
MQCKDALTLKLWSQKQIIVWAILGTVHSGVRMTEPYLTATIRCLNIVCNKFFFITEERA